MIIPSDYYTKEIEIKLTQSEIEIIIDSLKSNPYSIAEFYGETFTNLLKKLREGGE